MSITYPSASAGILLNQTWWILGDDAASLLKINLPLSQPNLNSATEIPLPFFREFKKDDTLRIKKKQKLDFEAMAIYQSEIQGDFIWAFGSGSIRPQRDTGLFWHFPKETKLNVEPYKVNLGPLYELLQRRSQISPEKWNIEGACIANKGQGALYLLNRTPSVLIKIPLRDWFRYVEIGSLPNETNISISNYQLPSINGFTAGFSGATYDSLRNSIWFSASVEITDDPVRDGEILGSFIGEISLTSGEINSTPLPITEIPHSPNKTKLESLSLGNVTQHQMRQFYGTIDNDNGGSELILVEVEIYD